MLLSWNVELFKFFGLYYGRVAQGVVWLIFVVLAAGVVYCAIQMSNYLVALTVRKNIGQSFAGGILLAIITSLPELTVAFTTGATNVPEMSFSNTMGSNSFFIFIFAIGSLFFIKKHKFVKNEGFYKSLIIEAILFSFVLFLTFIPNFWHPDLKNLITFLAWTIPYLNISWLFLAIFLIYIILIITAIWVHKHRTSNSFDITNDVIDEKEFKNHMSIQKIVIWFVIFVLSLVVLAFCLSITADILPHVYGIPETSVGGIILSFVTNCPEITSTLVLFKNNKSKIALGGLLGTLNFNFVINFFADLTFRRTGSLSHIINDDHLFLQYSLFTLIQFILISLISLSTTRMAQKNKFSYVLVNTIIIIVYITGWTLMLTIIPNI